MKDGYNQLVIPIFLFSNPLKSKKTKEIDQKVRYTDIFEAIHLNDVKAVKELINEGVDVNTKLYWGCTLLHEAVRFDNLELVTFLISKGADVNARVNDGRTPIFYAVLDGKIEIVKELISKGADIHIRLKDGSTLLKYANERGKWKIVDILRQAGAEDPTIGEDAICPYCQKKLDKKPLQKKKCLFCGKTIRVYGFKLFTEEGIDEYWKKWKEQCEREKEQYLRENDLSAPDVDSYLRFLQSHEMNEKELNNFKEEKEEQLKAEPEDQSILIRNKNGSGSFLHGRYTESPNRKFMLAFQDGHLEGEGILEKWMYGRVCLIEDKKRIIWDMEIERPNGGFVNNGGQVLIIDYLEPNKLGLGVMIYLFDIRGKRLAEYKFNSAYIGGGAFSSDGERIVLTTGFSDNSIYFFDMQNLRLIEKYKNPRPKILTQFTFDEIEEILLTFAKTQKILKELPTEKRKDFIFDSIVAKLKSNDNKTRLLGLEEVRPLIYEKEYKEQLPKIVSILIDNLNNLDEKIYDLSETIILSIGYREKSLIEAAIPIIIKRLREHPRQHPYYGNDLSMMGDIGRLNPGWIEELIPTIIDTLRSSKYWNERRSAAFAIDRIGSKKARLFKDAIPILLDQIKNIEKVKEEFEFIAKSDKDVALDLWAAKGLGADIKTMLRKAYIDALRKITGTGSSEIIKEAKTFLKNLWWDKNTHSYIEKMH